MTVGEMLVRMSASELAEWAAYDRVDPIGPERADLRAGIVAATIANVNRARRGRAARPADFMPRFGGTVTTGVDARIRAVMGALRKP